MENKKDKYEWFNPARQKHHRDAQLLFTLFYGASIVLLLVAGFLGDLLTFGFGVWVTGLMIVYGYYGVALRQSDRLERIESKVDQVLGRLADGQRFTTTTSRNRRK